MCDKDHSEEELRDFESRGLISRRTFGAIVGAGAVMLLPKVVGAVAVTESDVTIKTADGMCDAYFVHPATGTAPGVLVWPDIFGLRPAFRTMGKRLAEQGYSVLVVNPFYRTKKAPTASNGAASPFAEVSPLMASVNNEMINYNDSKAFIGWLDQQASVAKNRKIGTQGYCMGGFIAFRTAAAVPDRVGAVATFHGANLVTTGADSPHLKVGQTKAQYLIAIAQNDDAGKPNDKTTLKQALDAAKLQSEIEVYPAMHGWCPPDTNVYNMEAAEKAWTRLLALYGKALA
jgi:carboxymethylenebutenolidase